MKCNGANNVLVHLLCARCCTKCFACNSPWILITLQSGHTYHSTFHIGGWWSWLWEGCIICPSYIKQGVGRIRVKIHVMWPNDILCYVGNTMFTWSFNEKEIGMRWQLQTSDICSILPSFIMSIQTSLVNMTSLQVLRERKLKSNTTCFISLSCGYSFICPNVFCAFWHVWNFL